ncbi:MAG: MBL fold metallo-hydrolase [Anaerolineales bacterium]|nr:MBL fold metallo-hydrolase [Anaerolineales bacterium]MDD5467851.1 MBL fold metallo-hydrolase [Anaerolineales bacterium]
MLEVVTFVLGPAQTNAYLVAEPESSQAVVIDPAWDGKVILQEAGKRGWRIAHIWLTHAHFDHLGGAAAIVDGLQPPPPVAMHPEDQPLWRIAGGAAWFGMRIDPGPEPSIDLAHGQELRLGETTFEVRHVPGHTPGHVLFYCPAQKMAFCGDVIFAGSIGRTDFPGGDYDTLIRSIHTQVLSLPDETRLLSGHGPETTVGQERRRNPFLV